MLGIRNKGLEIIVNECQLTVDTAENKRFLKHSGKKLKLYFLVGISSLILHNCAQCLADFQTLIGQCLLGWYYNIINYHHGQKEYIL